MLMFELTQTLGQVYIWVAVRASKNFIHKYCKYFYIDVLRYAEESLPMKWNNIKSYRPYEKNDSVNI